MVRWLHDLWTGFGNCSADIGGACGKGGMTERQANWCQFSRWKSSRREKASHPLHLESWSAIREDGSQALTRERLSKRTPSPPLRGQAASDTGLDTTSTGRNVGSDSGTTAGRSRVSRRQVKTRFVFTS